MFRLRATILTCSHACGRGAMARASLALRGTRASYLMRSGCYSAEPRRMNRFSLRKGRKAIQFDPMVKQLQRLLRFTPHRGEMEGFRTDQN